jgi:hypothetical protein
MKRLAFLIAGFILGLITSVAVADSSTPANDGWSMFVEPGDGLMIARCRPDHPTHPCTTTTEVATSTTAPEVTTVPTTVVPTTTTTSTPATSTTVPSTTTTTLPPTTSTTIPPSSTSSSSTTSLPSSSTTTTTLPPVGGFPDASNTGVPAGVTLTAYTGPSELPAGTVIDSKLVTTCLHTTQSGVIIRRSRIQASCGWVVDAEVASGTWLLIEDSEINCAGGGGGNQGGLGEFGFTARRIEISGGCANNVDGDRNFTIEDSYLHSLQPEGSNHGDSIQSCCAANVTIRHNTLLGRSGDLSGNGGNTTSAIILPISLPPTGPILVERNFLGGGAYTLYCASTANQSILNNTFAHRPGPLGAAFGYHDNCQWPSVFSGNVTDTGLAVNR